MDASFRKNKVSNDQLVLPALVYEFVVHASENNDAEQSVLVIRRQRSIELGLDSLYRGICSDLDIR